MAKIFAKAFRGVPDGAIYPVDYAPGDECPDELIAGAEAEGALRSGKAAKAAAAEPASESGDAA